MELFTVVALLKLLLLPGVDAFANAVVVDDVVVVALGEGCVAVMDVRFVRKEGEAGR